MKKKPKTVLVMSSKGGSGKSMLVESLCYMADYAKVPYSVRDYDQQGGLDHKMVENPNAEVVFIDTPGYISKEVIDLIPDADIVVVPTNMALKDMKPLQNTIRILEPFIKKGKDVIFVLNQWDRYTTAKDFEEWFHSTYPEYETIKISRSEVIRQADEQGMGVIEYRPSSKAAAELTAFWLEVVEKHLGIKVDMKEA